MTNPRARNEYVRQWRKRRLASDPDYHKKRYAKNPLYRGPKRQEKEDSVRSLKERNPCLDCQRCYPFFMMDFDHCRGQKMFNIGLELSRRKLDEIKLEADKCEIVCANCHRVRTRWRIEMEVSRKMGKYIPIILGGSVN